jgi:hypothetical protein
LYSINVTDADGVSEVKMIYSLDGTVPDWSTAIGAGKYKLLSSVGGGTYEANYSIPSYDAAGGVVKYRFAVKDGEGVISYYPEVGALSFKDDLGVNCGAPTNFSGIIAPETQVDSSVMCPRDYQVTVSDLNGIAQVDIWYKMTDDGGLTYTTNTFTLTYLGSDTNGEIYGTTGFVIDTGTLTAPVTIYYRFMVTDGHGDVTKSAEFTFVDNFGCP